MSVYVADIEATAERIRSHVRRTPVTEYGANSLGLPSSLVLKLELFQHTGSFKPRGVFNRILSNRIGPAGIIAASGGNAGLAVAYAARELNIPAKIFVPRAVSPAKLSQFAQYGAEVTVEGDYYADAYLASRVHAERNGGLEVHAYDQEEIIAGQGTIGMELAEQMGAVDTVLVAVGGGGLFAGLASWFGNNTRIVAVEPQQCPTLRSALQAGTPVDVTVSGVAADSLGARRIGEYALELARHDTVETILVSDEQIQYARRQLWAGARIAAEPGGVTALAALISGAYKPEHLERTAVIICGGNSDPASLSAEKK